MSVIQTGLVAGTLSPILAIFLMAVTVMAQSTERNGYVPNRGPLFHAKEFEADPKLKAQVEHTVVLEPEGTEHLARYQLDEGAYQYCIDSQDTHISTLSVEDAQSRKLVSLVRGEPCREITLPAGIYVVRVTRDVSAAATGAPRLGFLSQPQPVFGGLAFGKGGWWAMRTDQGHVAVKPPAGTVGAYASSMPLIIDPNEKQFGPYSLFRFGSSCGFQVMAPDAGVVIVPSQYDVPVVATTAPPAGCPNYWALLGGLIISGSNSYRIQLGTLWTATSVIASGYSPLTVMFSGAWVNPPPFAEYDVLYRYFPSGEALDKVAAQEVAIYSECNYQGSAIYVGWDVPNLSDLSYPGHMLNAVGKSIQLGNNAGVTLYTGQNYTGTSTVVKQSQPCIANPTPIGSLQARPLATIVSASTKACIKCNLQSADFTGMDLSGVDLTGSNLSNAVFNKTTLKNTIFTGTTLSGTTFTCSDFSGTPGQLTDLSKILVPGLFQVDPNCHSNLSYTVFTPALVPPTSWKGQNLSHAVIKGLSATNPLSTKAQPLDLTGTNLSFTQLEGAVLDYATGLGGGTLTGVNLSSASLQYVNFSGALMYGAILTHANLLNANFSGTFLNKLDNVTATAADFTGSYLKNTNFSKAQLGSAVFSYASVFSTAAPGGACTASGDWTLSTCATFSGATLSLADFSNAFLYGVDFGNATIQGAHFDGAVLVASDFTGANLSPDGTGVATTMNAAFLQGATLDANSLDGIHFDEVFVDFGGDNVLTMQLQGAYTDFAGWGARGQPVCIQMFWNNPTVVPVNNPTIYCADGKAGPCGPASSDGSNLRWKSGIDFASAIPSATYQNDSTYVKAAQAVCAPLNTDW